MFILFPFPKSLRRPLAKLRTVLTACCLLGMSGAILASPALATPKLGAPLVTIRVNSLEDNNTSDSSITLREAILIVNGGVGDGAGDGLRTGLKRDLSAAEALLISGGPVGVGATAANIIFSDLPSSSTITLSMGTGTEYESLPPLLTSGVVIDGTSAAGTPITVNGSGAPDNTTIFWLGKGVQVNGITLRSLVVSGAKRYGIHLDQVQTSLISRCQVTQSVSYAIFIDGYAGGTDNNTIDSCTVGNNASQGIVLSGGNAFNNIVSNNRIGTDPTGMSAAPNAGGGLGLLGNLGFLTGAYGNYILNNTISGNTLQGILFDGPGRLVNGYINGNIVWGNRIGVSADGTAPIPNDHGIVLKNGAANNVIGGTFGGTFGDQPNIIAYNTGSGVVVKQTDLVGNKTSLKSIQGPADDFLVGTIPTYTVGNKISLNSIYQNGILGIDLLGDNLPTIGVSGGNPDPLEPTPGLPGPNRLSLRPTLTFAAAFNQNGYFEGAASPNSSIEIFEADQSPNPSFPTFGSGKTYCASTSTDANGVFVYSGTIACSPGKFFTATSTLPDGPLYSSAGSTSEFSENIANTPYIFYFPVVFNQ